MNKEDCVYNVVWCFDGVVNASIAFTFERAKKEYDCLVNTVKAKNIRIQNGWINFIGQFGCLISIYKGN